MSKALYRYNEDTCQYERIKVKTPDVLFYASGVIVSAVILLACLLVLHDYFFDSEKEIALRKENRTLQRSQALLNSRLDEVDGTLKQLESEDEQLHLKFFGASLEKPASKETASRQILLADASSFRSTLEKLSERSATLLSKSSVTTSYFSDNLSVSEKKAEKIIGMPTALPIADWSNEKLVSGFGMRINPFHKGLYEHPGIDIAAPRGTEVIATANGTVIIASKNALQAGYGNYVEIDHGGGFVTRFAHMEELKVKAGQRVKKGTIIGTIGNTGGSVAPHLHYEIVKSGKPVDPVYFMVEAVTSDVYEGLRSTSLKHNQSLD